MTCTILGSGFGLYGYLPAILDCGQQVVLPRRYRSLLESRNDVRHLESQVHWCEDEDFALRSADTVILARRPSDQMQLCRICLQSPNVLRIILEKPLAPDPGSANVMMSDLTKSGKRFRIGYTFRYTHWGHALKEWSKSGETGDSLLIEWKFRATHYASNLVSWKRLVSRGGGAIRFYGIHLIALLAELGYNDVSQSLARSCKDDEVSDWSALLTGPRLPKCIINIHSNSEDECFSISDDKTLCTRLNHPFNGHYQKNVLDGRIPALTHLCTDLLFGKLLYYPWYAKTVRLWQLVEDRTLANP